MLPECEPLAFNAHYRALGSHNIIDTKRGAVAVAATACPA
jgi:hypothetical protein